MFPRDASVDELIEFVNSSNFDPIKEINDALAPKKSIQEQHPTSVELMVRLNAYVQDITEELQSTLEELEKSGKRIPHEIDLLKNDVHSFDDQQREKLPKLTNLINTSRRDDVLKELASLNEVRARIKSVEQLLQKSQKPTSEISESEQKQLAEVFADTPDAHKWTASISEPTSKNYYGLFNKLTST